METEPAEQKELQRPTDFLPHRWYIGLLADGTYRFITPNTIKEAEKYIGDHGGAVYTHAGYLIFANRQWFNWLERQYQEKNKFTPEAKRPPYIDVPNLECSFSEEALKWLEDNDSLLQEVGGKYYANVPRH